MSKPTLDDLKRLAEAAREWIPDSDCVNYRIATQRPCRPGFLCSYCLGAKRAAGDVAEHVDEALRDCEAFDEDGHPSRDQAACEDATFAIVEVQIASRIESYFGAPGPVAAFSAAVWEFCL